MNLSFTPAAAADLEAIRTFLAEDDLAVAERVVARILQSVSMLETFPMLGRPGRVNDTRELTIAGLPYFAVYRIADATEIDVIAVMHTRRQYP